ncbi:hypothetical protein [Sphingomonas sp. Leaf23]|uniref:hypothetical protein n=1 Tax=Sphingomonas sp. Leaf23 TaxID=1735689 RepID=UPI0012E0DB32|nr:hypothetical protein [Sphingomonas sp. Leaf23]
MADIIELSQRVIARDAKNSPKVAALFIIASGCWFVLDLAGIKDLTIPWLAAPLLPIAAIYLMERSGTIHWFKGMTLPSLCVLASVVAFVWVLKSKYPLPTVSIYVALGSFIAAFSFLMFRMWTYQPIDRDVH